MSSYLDFPSIEGDKSVDFCNSKLSYLDMPQPEQRKNSADAELRPTDFTEKHSTHTVRRISREPSFDRRSSHGSNGSEGGNPSYPRQSNSQKSFKAPHRKSALYGPRPPGNSKSRQVGREMFCCGRKDVLRRFQPRSVLFVCAVGALIFLIPTLCYGNILYRPPIYENFDVEKFAGDNQEYVIGFLGGEGLYFVGWWILWPILLASALSNFLYIMSYCCFSRGAAVAATVMMLFFGFLSFIFMIIFFCAAGRWSYFFGSPQAVDHLKWEILVSNAFTTDEEDVFEWLQDHQMAYWIAGVCLLLHWIAVWAVVAPLSICFLKQKGHDDEEVRSILPTTDKDKEAIYGANHRYQTSIRNRINVNILKKPPKLAPENVLHGNERYQKNMLKRVLNSTDHYEGQPDCYHGPDCDHGLGYHEKDKEYVTDLSRDPTLSTHRPNMASILRNQSAENFRADMTVHNPVREVPSDRTYYGTPARSAPAARRPRSVPRTVTFASQSTFINPDNGAIASVDLQRADIQKHGQQLRHSGKSHHPNARNRREAGVLDKMKRSRMNCWNWACVTPLPARRSSQMRRGSSGDVYYDVSRSNYYNDQRFNGRRNSNPVISSSRRLCSSFFI